MLIDREALRRRLKCAEQNPPDQLPRMHRLGDALIAESRAASVLEETAGQVLRHGARRGYFGPIKSQSSSLSLMSYKLISLEFGPEIVNGLQFMTILNLAKNNLYDSAALFSALSQLGNLAHLDVSENFLNGDLDVSAGGLHALETINLASNNITALPASVGSWARVRSVNISFNSLTGR
jgi:Leucine-rich repeat (LRR) protein